MANKFAALVSPHEGKIQFIDEFYINPNLEIADGIYSVMVEVLDPRCITHQQRKFLYAMFYDIAMFCEGYCDELSKEYYKNFFKQTLIDNDLIDDFISLSDCSMTEANIMIDFVLEFVFRNNIPLRYETVRECDDLERWQYMCVKHRRCCICGQKAHIHHVEGSRIGMGNDRSKTSNIGREVMALCSDHHGEIHAHSEKKFFEKYHVKPLLITEENINDLKL